MNAFISWFEGMEPSLRAYWVVALLASLVFLIQMVLTLVGIGDTDSDVDFDGSSDADLGDGSGDTMDTGGAIQLFTIRNMVNFLLGIGWGGVCFWNVVPNRFLLAVVALICGCILVAAFLFMYRKLMKLESNGAFDIREAVGQVATVYMRIPASRSGQGKVQVSFGGSVQELPAATAGVAIPSGAQVRVTELIGNKVLLVEAI
jgi:hypothetical protein